MATGKQTIGALTIELTITDAALKGQLQHAMNVLNGFTAQVNGKGNVLSNQISGFATKISNTLITASKAAAAAVTGAMVAFGALTVKEGSKFEQQMARVGAISGATGAEFQALTDSAREIGRTTLYTGVQAAEGLEMLVAAGYDSADAMKMIGPAAIFAGVNMADLEQTVFLLASTLQQFGMGADDTMHVLDVISMAMQRSTLDFESVSEAMKYAGSVGSGFGNTLEDVMVTLEMIRSIGLVGSMVGTNYREMMAGSASVTDKGRRILEHYGLTLNDINMEMNRTQDVFRKIGESSMNATDALVIFGLRAGGNIYKISKLMAENKISFDEMREDLLDSAGALNEMYARMLATTMSQWKIVWGNMKDLAIGTFYTITNEMQALAQAVLPILQFLQRAVTQNAIGLTGVVRSMIQSITDEMSLSRIKFLQMIMGMINGMQMLVESVKTAISWFAKMTDVIQSVLTPWNKLIQSRMKKEGGMLVPSDKELRSVMSTEDKLLSLNKEYTDSVYARIDAEKKIEDIENALATETRPTAIRALENQLFAQEQARDAASQVIRSTSKEMDNLITIKKRDERVTRENADAEKAMQEELARLDQEIAQALRDSKEFFDANVDGAGKAKAAYKELYGWAVKLLEVYSGMATGISKERQLERELTTLREGYESMRAEIMRTRKEYELLMAMEQREQAGGAKMSEINRQKLADYRNLYKSFEALPDAIGDVETQLRTLYAEMEMEGDIAEKSAPAKLTADYEHMAEAQGQVVEASRQMIEAGKGEETMAEKKARRLKELRELQQQLRLQILNLETMLTEQGGTDSPYYESLGLMRDEAQKTLTAVGQAIDSEFGEERWNRIREIMKGFAEFMGRVFMNAAEVIKQAFRGVAKFLEGITGTTLSSFGPGAVLEVAGTSGGTEDTGFKGSTYEASMGAVSKQFARAGAYLEQVVKNLPWVLHRFIKEIPGIVTAVVQSIPRIVNAFISYLPGIIYRVVDGLGEVVDTLIARMPAIIEALIRIVKSVFPKLVNIVVDLVMAIVQYAPVLIKAIIRELPGIVTKIVEFLPVFIMALAEQLPSIIKLIVKVIPDILLAIVAAIPAILGSLINMLVEVAAALVEAILTELLPRLPEMALAVITALFNIFFKVLPALVKKLLTETLPALYEAAKEFIAEMWDNFWKTIKRFFKDVWKELKSLGRAETKTFGDTPGVIRAGVSGMVAAFAPGDLVVAAQSMTGIARQLAAAQTGSQVAAAMGGGGTTSVSVRVALDGRDVDGCLVHAGKAGRAPAVYRAIRRTRGQKVGLDPGRFRRYS